MIFQKLIISFLFLLSIPVLIFFRKKTSQNIRKSISYKNDKLLHFYKISYFVVNKIYPILILIFLMLFWFDIIEIPIRK